MTAAGRDWPTGSPSTAGWNTLVLRSNGRPDTRSGHLPNNIPRYAQLVAVQVTTTLLDVVPRSHRCHEGHPRLTVVSRRQPGPPAARRVITRPDSQTPRTTVGTPRLPRTPHQMIVRLGCCEIADLGPRHEPVTPRGHGRVPIVRSRPCRGILALCLSRTSSVRSRGADDWPRFTTCWVASFRTGLSTAACELLQTAWSRRGGDLRVCVIRLDAGSASAGCPSPRSPGRGADHVSGPADPVWP